MHNDARCSSARAIQRAQKQIASAREASFVHTVARVAEYVKQIYTILKIDNHMHLFLARDCVKVAKQHLDENERLTVMKVKLEEAVNMVMDGRINANSTAHLILRAARLLEKEMIDIK